MKIINKKVFYDYEIVDRLEAGINLTGAEVKAIRGGHVDLSGSFVKFVAGEAYLVNAKIYSYSFARKEGYDEKRTRKLLLHRKELIALKSKIDGANLTIVPISVYTNHRLIKIELGVAKGKKQYDKKAAIKKRDLDRDIEEEFAGRLR
ncbi:SsrA-binding protein [Candidatus Levyibacteriota bacterium]|nr:SsrA-binding protein SmpB [Candidatus Levybacteria bacterium]MSU26159.1 SsrA-binding protein SmpB [Candidatus Levybacteria bacterium]GDX62226.1 SsrA-binding protein [Candidatus Levybacteria bacterium]